GWERNHHVIRQGWTRRRCADADAQPRVLARPQRRLDRLQSVVATGTAAGAEPHAADRERHVVHDDQQVVLDDEALGGNERPQRLPAPVHVGQGLDELDFLAAEHTGGDARVRDPPERSEPPVRRNPVQDPPAQVVARRLVRRAGIAQPTDDLHGPVVRLRRAERLYSASPASSAARLRISSGSTSPPGPSGASASVSRAATVGGTIELSTRSASVSISTPSGTLRSETCSDSPTSRAEMSISSASGIWSGRQRTSMSCSVCWRMPPALTPAAVPTRRTGTSRCTRSPAWTWKKSTCRISGRNGCICTSRTRARTGPPRSPSIFREMIVFST